MTRTTSGGPARVVVLNASYELLSVVAVHRAVAYLLREKAEIVAIGDGQAIRSPSGVRVDVPSVVRLLRYVRIPHHAQLAPWTRAGLMRRDRHTCAYCGRYGTTVEHLLPLSRGGRTTWVNTVVACAKCNNRKADRTPEEAKMKLARRPTTPTVQGALLQALGKSERKVLAGLGLVTAD